MNISVAHVAHLSNLYSFSGQIWQEIHAEVGKDVAAMEALVHELAHAAVLRIHPRHMRRSHNDLIDLGFLAKLSARVGDRFSKYENRFYAELSECSTLAVERVVFDLFYDRIGEGRLTPDAFETLVFLAVEDMRVLKSPRAFLEIEHRTKTKLTMKRAKQVIHWLEAFTGTSFP